MNDEYEHGHKHEQEHGHDMYKVKYKVCEYVQ